MPGVVQKDSTCYYLDMKRFFSDNGYYHIYNRGALKQRLFFDKKDYCRFLLLIIASQSQEDNSLKNLSRSIQKGSIEEVMSFIEKNKENTLSKRSVEVLNFCIMPNHFHLTIHELEDNGISKYMQKVLNSYGKYFNKKYNKNGHVFQGPYKVKHILEDNQLSYLSAYIHNNPKEINRWNNKPWEYDWSSYGDYVEENRWGELLNTDFILTFHKDKKDYKKLVIESGAKNSSK